MTCVEKGLEIRAWKGRFYELYHVDGLERTGAGDEDGDPPISDGNDGFV